MIRTRVVHRRAASTIRPAFTLVELLVVIGIIVLLIGILLPVIGKVRIASQAADTRNFINELGAAIERYQQDFRAYPGPLSNNEIADPLAYPAAGSPITAFTIVSVVGYDTTSQSNTVMPKKWTMSENLVLGLLGGLHLDTTTTTQLDYDPSLVGGGPTSLSTVAVNKHYPAYLDAKQLSWQNNANGKSGHYFDGAGDADDSIIPEFVDRFTDPLPILYMRAKVGANPQPTDVSAGTFGNSFNPIITNDASETSAPTASGGFAVRAGQYDLSQIIAYTGAYTGSWPSLSSASAAAGRSIGVGKSAKSSAYTTPPMSGEYHGIQSVTYSTTPSLTSTYPYNAYPYFIGSSGVARQKDAYILISAGPDRVYGTADDLANFGNVGE